MSNTELTHSLATFEHSFASAAALADGERLTDFTGQSSGTVIMVLSGREVTQSAMFDDVGPKVAPGAAISAIQSRQWKPGTRETIEFGDLGRYRVGSVDAGRDTVLISAISLKNAEAAIAKKTAAVAVVIIAAAVLAAAGTVLLVRRALRPVAS